MAYTTIDDPSAYFQVSTWTGNATSRTIDLDSNSTMQPDFSWVKSRSNAYENYWQNSSIGTDKYLRSNRTSSEQSGTIVTYNSSGFGIGSGAENNENSTTNVGWFWKANGGSTSSNTDGDLTSTVQFNSTAKFSIITYTGIDPIEPLDIGHGMGEAPDVFIVKNRDRTTNWGVYHKDLTSPAENYNLKLNLTNAQAAESTFWRNEAPTSTIIKTGENASVNVASEKFIIYAWKEVQGFSKFGKYVGNGSTDGTFVYTGFKPACVIIKCSSAVSHWRIFDYKRLGYNPSNSKLYPNLINAESTATEIDFLSNGFKIRSSDTDVGNNSSDYIYMAWAKNPFVSSGGIPATAR